MVKWVDSSLNMSGSLLCGWRCHRHLSVKTYHQGDKVASRAEDNR